MFGSIFSPNNCDYLFFQSPDQTRTISNRTSFSYHPIFILWVVRRFVWRSLRSRLRRVLRRSPPYVLRLVPWFVPVCIVFRLRSERLKAITVYKLWLQNSSNTECNLVFVTIVFTILDYGIWGFLRTARTFSSATSTIIAHTWITFTRLGFGQAPICAEAPTCIVGRIIIKITAA